MLVCFALVGCGGQSDGLAGGEARGTDDGASEAGTDGGGDGDSTGASSSESGEDDDGLSGEGLPCDVDEILQLYCRSCHGAAMLAPSPLGSRADLLADSLSQTGVSVGGVAASRLNHPDQPMPPPPGAPVPGAEQEIFAAWVAAGMPTGSCGEDDPLPDPFDVDPTCTSDVWWTQRLDEGSPHMNPGRPCVGCHEDPTAFGIEADEETPATPVGGTLFPTAHEPDDCYGVDGTVEDVYIELSHDDGDVLTIPVNAAGNFLLEPGDVEGFEPPYRVRVVRGELQRVMVDLAPHGDC
ncbi:MAG: hypothetical protein AAF721_28190, partial [Myxococcota bacterium]